MAEPLSFSDLKSSIPEGGLFRGETPWRLSPSPFLITKKEAKELQSLGFILSQFYEACRLIYNASADARAHEWVAGLLDAGKPEWLIDIQRQACMRQQGPRVIRPDLMAVEDGWAVSELDSVPGGQGVAAFLTSLYSRAGWNVFGGENGIIDGFREAHPEGAEILVSRESSDYRAEMEYLASRLGDTYSCLEAEEWKPGDETDKKIQYRFFELFDVENIPPARHLLESAGRGERSLSPPPVPHLEEKMWLALFHTPGLQKTWKKLLRGAHWERLHRLIPKGWPVVSSPHSPYFALPWLNVYDWEDVAAMTQSERRLVLKISGFHETAWGARGVFMGHDMPGEEWKLRLGTALSQSNSSPWILQEFTQGRLVEHPYYDPDSGELKIMKGRVRLCPYYYCLPDGTVQAGGSLATIVPEDKKKIHGMKDAILVPCAIRD